MLIFEVLHILSMFIALTLLMGDAVFLALAFQRRDVRALASFQRLVGARTTYIGGSMFLLGIVFGLLTAATGSIDFFKGWLIAAYGLVAAVLFVNASPFVQRIRKVAIEALEADAGQRSPEEVAPPHVEHSDRIVSFGRAQRSALCRDHRGHGREAVLIPET